MDKRMLRLRAQVLNDADMVRYLHELQERPAPAALRAAVMADVALVGQVSQLTVQQNLLAPAALRQSVLADALVVKARQEASSVLDKLYDNLFRSRQRRARWLSWSGFVAMPAVAGLLLSFAGVFFIAEGATPSATELQPSLIAEQEWDQVWVDDAWLWDEQATHETS